MEPQKTPSQQQSDEVLANLGLTSETRTPQTTESSPGNPSPNTVGAGMPNASMPGVTFKPQEPAAPSTFSGASLGSEAGVASSPDPVSTDAQPIPDQGDGLPATPDMIPSMLSVTAPKHRKKGLVIGLVVAAAVLILSGSAAAAYYYVLNTPENVLKRSLANVLDAGRTKTIQYSGSVDIEDDSADMSLKGTYRGQASTETGAFDISGKLDAVITNLTFDARSVDGKSLYLKVGGLDGLAQILFAGSGLMEEDSPTAVMYAQIIDSVNDQWLEVNESLTNQYVRESPFKSGELTESDRQKLVNAYKAHSFIVVKESLPDESIKGQNSHHYKLGVDKTQLKAFVAALKSANLSVLKLTDEHLKAFNKDVDAAKLDKENVEIWIAKRGKAITQLSYTTTEDGATFKLVFTVESYNKPVQIQKPEDAKSLLDVMGDFLGGLTSGSDSLLPDLNPQSGISL